MTQAYNDMMMEYLSDYHGNFNERLYQYLYDLGYVEKTLPERIRSAEYKTSPDGTFKRDFLTLSGTTDGVLFGSLVTIPASTDFSISWRGQWPNYGTGYIFGNTTGTNSESDRVAIGDGPKLYGLNFQGAPLSFSASDRSIHTFLIERLDGNVSFLVDGVIKATSYYDPVVRVNSIGMQFGGPTSTPPFSGVMMDFKITVDGMFSNYWSINAAGDTILDVVGGNHGTLINGSSSDWERFEKAPGWRYWLGEELWGIKTIAVTGESSWDSTTNTGRVFSSDGSYSQISTPTVLVSGVEYRRAVTVDAVVEPGLGLRLDNAGGDVPAVVGRHFNIGVADSTSALIKRYGGVTDIYVSNPSFRKVLREAV